MAGLVAPKRGFPAAEYEGRAERARRVMVEQRLDGIVVTSPPNVRYVSGFDTQFWESPTRPWFVVLPREGGPIAIIPEIGVPGMEVTWVKDIRSWPAPRPADDGVSLLTAALAQLPRRFGRIGWELGRESVVRMPLIDYARVRDGLPGLEFVDGTPLIRALRGVKSEAEIGHLRYICQLTSDAFAALPAKLRAGDSERDACRKLRLDLIERGADHSPYLIGVAGPAGYDNIIMGPTDRRIDRGDILIIDTGTVFDGYYCDFDRNYAFGRPADAARRAHEAVWDATEAGIRAARPGATTSDVWRAMTKVLEAGGSIGNNVGRLGHGLGLQLTEPPSNMPGDDTVIAPNMVLTIEPGMSYAPGKMIVHEENIVVRVDGAELLTKRAPREMWVVEA